MRTLTPNRTALAVKQPGTDVVFQRLDVAGQGGLADIQCLCSPGKIPLLGEHDRIA